MKDLGNKISLSQVNGINIIAEVNTYFNLLAEELKKDTKMSLSLVQSFISSYELVDELRKRLENSPNNIKHLLDPNKTLTDLVNDSAFGSLQTYIGSLNADNFKPPLSPPFMSCTGADVYNFPTNLIDKDPRRTGYLVRVGPDGVLGRSEIQKWIVNKGPFYGFVLYDVSALYYVGAKTIQDLLKKAGNDKQSELKRIVGRFINKKNELILSSIVINAQDIINKPLF